MADLFSYSAAGLGFLLVAAIEALLLFKPSSLPLDLRFLRYLSILLLSCLTVLYYLLSSLFSSSSGDPLGHTLPLSAAAAAAAAAAPFLLYALGGLLLPSLHPLLSLISFLQELLFLLLRRNDLDGVENRCFDLLLVPVLVCLASTALSLARPRSPFPCQARAAGLALHGTWLRQMAFSFFSSAVAHGCFLHRRSWANYTVRCKGHPEYHRGRAIAALQFNCHLALLVVVAVGVYVAVVNSGGRARGGEGYRPLNKELQRMNNADLAKFSLEDDEDEEGINGRDGAVPVSEMRNGFNASH